MGHRPALAHHARNHVFAEIVAGLRVGQIVFQQVVQILGVEDVNTHACQRHRVVAGHGRRVGGLFHKLGDLSGAVNGHHTKGSGLFAWHFNAAHGAACAALHVVFEHQRVIHLVDVVAGQHHHVLGLAALDDVQVLIDRIGRAAVPVLLVHPLLGGQQVDHLVQLSTQEAPATLQVAQQ